MTLLHQAGQVMKVDTGPFGGNAYASADDTDTDTDNNPSVVRVPNGSVVLVIKSVNTDCVVVTCNGDMCWIPNYFLVKMS